MGGAHGEQLPVLSSQFSVLGSRFSVLGSQFSVKGNTLRRPFCFDFFALLGRVYGEMLAESIAEF
jgi:hypothetical protein